MEGGDIEVQCFDCPSDGGRYTQGVEAPGGLYGLTLAGRNQADFSLEGDAVLSSTGLGEGDGVGDACQELVIE